MVPAMARIIFLAVESGRPMYLAGTQFLATVYGIWNLDFFRSFNLGICLETDTLETLALDLIVGIYPLLLVLISYVIVKLYEKDLRLLFFLWKPFHIVLSFFRRNWEY